MLFLYGWDYSWNIYIHIYLRIVSIVMCKDPGWSIIWTRVWWLKMSAIGWFKKQLSPFNIECQKLLNSLATKCPLWRSMQFCFCKSKKAFCLTILLTPCSAVLLVDAFLDVLESEEHSHFFCSYQICQEVNLNSGLRDAHCRTRFLTQKKKPEEK